jgi:hypothetical protein
MEKHNILGKKAEASAAFKEKIISLVAWTFILFCSVLVIFLSKMGLKALFLNSNKHFTLENIHVQAKGLPEHTKGLVNISALTDSLQLYPGTDNLFEVDLKELRAKVQKNISVKSSEVSYIFPGTIKIDFIEKDPIARFMNSNLIDKHGNIIPPGRNDLTLPVIMSKNYKIGTKATENDVRVPLKLIRYHESFNMVYKPVKGLPYKKDILDPKKKIEIAALELIKIKMISLNDDNSIGVILHGAANFMVADNARLKLPVDDFEIGLRRACIAIIQNALVRKETRKIDARYNSTPTE